MINEKIYKVWIDAGHGGQDPGASGNGLVEKNINLSVALELKKMLEAKGIIVGMTRIDDVKIELGDVSKIANDFKPDLFISIHHNAGGGDGFEIIYQSTIPKSKEMAELITVEYKKLNNFRKIYVKISDKTNRDYFSVLRYSNCPAIISEFAFLDSIDYQSIDEYKDIIAEAAALAAAVFKYFKIDNVIGSEKESEKNEYIKEDKKTWGEIEIEKLKAKKIINANHAPEETVTWAEFAAVLNKILDKN